MNEEEFLNGLSDEEWEGFQHGDLSKLSDENFSKLEKIKAGAAEKSITSPGLSMPEQIETVGGAAMKMIPFAEGAAHHLGFDDWLKRQALREQKFPIHSGIGQVAGAAALIAGGPEEFFLGKTGEAAADLAPYGLKTIAKYGTRVTGAGAVAGADAATKGQDPIDAAENAALFQGGAEVVSAPFRGAKSIAKDTARAVIDVPDPVYQSYLKNPKEIDEAKSMGRVAQDLVEEKSKIPGRVAARSMQSREFLGSGEMSVDQLVRRKNEVLKEIANSPTIPVAEKAAAKQAVTEAFQEVGARAIHVTPNGPEARETLSNDDIKDILISLDKGINYSPDQKYSPKIMNKYRKMYRGKISEDLRAENPEYASFMDEFVSPQEKANAELNKIIPKKNQDTVAGRLRRIASNPEERFSGDESLKKVDEWLKTDYGKQATRAYEKEVLTKPMPGSGGIPSSRSGVIQKVALKLLGGGDKREAIKLVESWPARWSGKLIDAMNKGDISFIATHQNLEKTDPEYKKFIEEGK